MEEQLLRDMQEELRSMTEALLRLSASGLKINDQRLVVAIGQLAKSSSEAAKNSRRQSNSVENFIKDVDRATKSLDAHTKSVQESDSQLDKAAESAMNREQRRTLDDQRWRTTQSRSVNTFSKQMWEMSDKSETFANRVVLVNQALSGLANVGMSTTQFAVGLTNGNRSFTALNPVVDSVTNAIANLAQAVPLFGGILGAAARGFGEAAKFAVANLQKTVEIFEDLSAVGALTTEGMSGVQEQFLASRMTMEGFKSTVIANAATLARFGGTVGTGTTRFANFVGELQRSEAGEQLRLLGFNADAIGETAAAFVSQQTRLGLAQRKSQAELSQGTAQYARELDILSKLTGTNRKAMQQAQEAALSEPRFRAKMNELARTGQDELAKDLNLLQAAISEASGPVGQGFRDIIAANGMITSEAAKQLYTLTGGEIQDIARRALAGEDIGQVFAAASAAVQKGTENFEKLQQVTDLTSVIGDLASASDFGVLSLNGLDEQIKKLRTGQVEQTENADELTKKTVEARIGMDKIANTLTEFGFSLTRDAAPAVEAFTKTLDEAIDFVADKLGLELRGSRERRVEQHARAQQEHEQRTKDQVAQDAMISGITPSPEQEDSPTGSPDANKPKSGLLKPGFLGLGPQVPGSGGYASQEDLVGLGLNLKQGDVQEEQARISPKLIDLAKKIQSEIPGFGRFTAFNDNYHRRERSGSQHVQGMALDFTVGKYDPATAKDIVAQIKSMGASSVDDEYANPSPGATGPHFHVEIPEFQRGGIATGPKSGYQAMLHGTEAVIPLADNRSVPVQMPDFSRGFEQQADLLNQQISRLDELVTAMRNQNSISSKMLQVSQA
jgi:hypothetical protein